MITNSNVRRVTIALALAACVATNAAAQQATPFEPVVGQEGKDVVWVPTPPELVEKMLDIAKVTPRDYVMDLGSGDGRNVIAAARRGATALGVEYNPEMVELSKRNAAAAGVTGKATFVQGDMYEADISMATVMAVYLLPANMDKLLPKFLALAPGTRIVANTFGFTDWDPDERATAKDCTDWCEALLWIVPAKVAGTWLLDDGMGTLALTQLNQVLYGSLTIGISKAPIGKAKMRGGDIAFTVGDQIYTGRVSGSSMQGTVSGPAGNRDWRAARVVREP
jgi:SAM-dependent methyltransferase